MSSSKKTVSNQTQSGTTNVVQTPTNPAFVTQGLGQIGANVNAAASADPYSFVAGPNALLTQAATGAARLGNYGSSPSSAPYGGGAGGVLATDASGNVIPQGPNGAMSQAQLDAMNANRQAAGIAPHPNPANAAALSSAMHDFGGSPSQTAGQSAAPGGPMQTMGFGSGAPSVDPFANAASVANGVAGAAPASVSSHLAEFQNPYTNDVVNTTLAGYDQAAGRQRASDQLGLAGDATFGGSGGSILQAMDNQNLNMGRAQTEAQLRNQGFDTAMTGATSQAGLDSTAQAQRLAAAGVLSGNAAAQSAAQNQNVQTQSQIAQLLQQIDQAKAAAPISAAGSLASIYGNPAFGLLHGSTAAGTTNGTTNGTTTESSSDPMKAIGTAVQTAALLFSDRRLKTDIKRVGELDNGLAVFKYRYKAGGPMQIGVMGQDVQKKNPDAVRNIGGLLAVDYGKAA
jgi:hypothetical protein